MKHLKIGITQGDINSTNYEIIMKVLSEQHVLDGNTFVLYGSSKAVAYYKKSLELQNCNFNIIRSAEEAVLRKANLVNCVDEDIHIEPGMQTVDAGKATIDALKSALIDLKKNAIDILVSMPFSKEVVRKSNSDFQSLTNFLAQEFGTTQQVELFVNDMMKTCAVSSETSLTRVAKSITKDAILEKIVAVNDALTEDFAITRPKIAVLSLNDEEGDEEKQVIIPAINEAKENGYFCVGPYQAERFFARGEFSHFDVVIGMYRGQVVAPFKALAYEDSMSYTIGLPKIVVSPALIADYENVNKNCSFASALLTAIFSASSIVEKREMYEMLQQNKLKN